MTKEELSLRMATDSFTIGSIRPDTTVWSYPRVPVSRNPIDPVINLTPEQEQQIKDMSVAVKADAGKADWSLMPFECVEEINKVLEFGVKKYSADNWKQGGGFKYRRILNSLLRHIFAYMRGEDTDPESGLSHMAHAGCNVIFLLYYAKYKNKFTTNDDRSKV
jgi:hypothetical protein